MLIKGCIGVGRWLIASDVRCGSGESEGSRDAIVQVVLGVDGECRLGERRSNAYRVDEQGDHATDNCQCCRHPMPLEWHQARDYGKDELDDDDGGQDQAAIAHHTAEPHTAAETAE